jgi:biotin carboxylase
MIGGPKVVFLGGGSDAVPIVARGLAMGVRPIVVDFNADCPARHLGEFVLASCYDATSTLNALQEIGARPDGVLCAGVDAPHVAAAVVERYGLPGPDPITAAFSQDKLLQNEVLGELVSVPLTFPGPVAHPGWVVVKPVDSRGGRGVSRVMPHRLAEAWATAVRHSPTGRAMVQEWLDGPQLSTESIIQNGEVLFTAIAERNYSRLEEFSPAVIEDGSDMPCPELGDPDNGGFEWQVIQAMRLAAQAIGLGTGILKGDLVWHNSRPYVVEVAARLSGGGFCSLMTPAVWGVDVVGAAIDQCLGRKPVVPRPYLRTHVCQRFRFPRRPWSHPERGDFVLGFGMSRAVARLDAERKLA